jgi:O-antigen/teichoic acid export membrane protein
MTNYIRKIQERINNNKLIKRFISGLYWSLVSTIIWRISSAFSTVIIARILGPQYFGAFSILQSTMKMFYSFGGARLGSTSTKFISQYRENNKQRAMQILKLSQGIGFIFTSFVAVIFLASSPYLAEQFIKNNELIVALCICAFQMLFLNFALLRESALAGFENFKNIANGNILRGVLTPILCIPLTLLYGVDGAILGLTIVAAIAFIKHSSSLRTAISANSLDTNVTWRQAFSEHKVLTSFSIPAILIGIIVSMITWSGRLYFTDGAEQLSALGNFEAANQWRTAILFLPAAMVRVFLPMISRAHSGAADDNASTVVTMQFKSVCLVTLPMVVLTITTSSLLASLYGNNFSQVEPLMPLLMTSVFFFSLNQLMRQTLNGVGRAWTNLFIHLLWGAVFLLSCYIFIPTYGVFGFAIAYLASEATHFIAQALLIDFYILPKCLRKNLILFIYCFTLIISSALLQYNSLDNGYLTSPLLIILSSIPVMRIIYSYSRP